jgi:tetratricopeptide (TPR) repeat protein
MFISPQDLDQVQELCRDGRFDEAQKLCADFIGEHPDHPLGYHLRATVRFLMGDPVMALPDRDRVVALCPGDPGAYLARADALMAVEDFVAAIGDLDRAERFDNGHFGAAIPLFRAECHRRLGQYDAALADCARVPDDFVFPGFRGQPDGSKHPLVAEIEDAMRRDAAG